MSADGEALDFVRFRAALAPFGVRAAARWIRGGDEAAFLDAEPPPTTTNLARRRASGAARIAARSLLRELGGDGGAALNRSSSGAAKWPDGFLGSLAHDDQFALAVVAREGVLAALGADIEPAEPLPADILDIVASRWELRSIGGDRMLARMIFCAKEAVYKAFNPLDGSKLEFEDIEIRFAEGRAILRDGRSPRLIFDVGRRLIATALVTAGGAPPRSCDMDW